MSNDLEARVLQIRRAHAQAKPKDSNPAWKNCHRDMEVMFKFIKELEDECRALSALNREIDAKLSELERQNAELRNGKSTGLGVMQNLIDYIEVPEPNCSCHLSPPCNDCVDYSDIRETIDTAKILIAADQKGKAS